MLAIVSAGIAPGIALLSFFYLKDEIETEPLYEVLRVFFLGAILVFPIMFIQYVLEVEQVIAVNLFKAFLSASLLEEFFKWFILYFAVFKLVEFDEHYDGIVYGVAISLGFATAENILYLFSYGLEYAFGRALLPVSSHALFGVIMGYYLGKGKFSSDKPYKWIALSFFVPFLLHGLYDFILLTDKNWLVIIIPFMLFLWWLALKKVKKAKAIPVYPDNNRSIF
ncbi:glutamic-type intramembrane protease PrsW [Bacillus kwashiorkori]|uniref:glutamic-type intramembrane protease PrsW n=1 Tax=Bacillus kwashiorkori TaxID=1522318 RepID=UPI000785F113|nr:glutamic-type intramembrane protease PrsW [Bacillus kwashiorkori]